MKVVGESAEPSEALQSFVVVLVAIVVAPAEDSEVSEAPLFKILIPEMVEEHVRLCGGGGVGRQAGAHPQAVRACMGEWVR